LSGEILDELEGHLREEVDEQVRSGKTSEDAFKSAVIQMGHSRELGVEFSKLNAGGAQRPKYLAVFCFLSAALIAINAIAIYPEFAEKASLSRLLVFIGILGIFAYLAALPFCYRRLPDLRRPVVAWALNLGSLLVSFWVLLALLSALELVQVKLGKGAVQLFWAIVPAFFATLLAYKTFAFGRNAIRKPIVKTLSPDVNQALRLARDEAIHLGHDFIGTEHLLLGLLRTENRTTAQVLKKFGLDEHLIRSDVEKVVGRGCAQSSPGTIPYTPRSKSVIDFAGREAAAMDCSAIGPEHLFLGLLHEPTGVAGVVLRNLGADLEQARAEILKAIRPDDDAGPAPAVAA
jgi:uncharacterized membrane protein YhaH (DUF805 family)